MAQAVTHDHHDTNNPNRRRMPPAIPGIQPGALLLGFAEAYAKTLQRYIEIQGYQVNSYSDLAAMATDGLTKLVDYRLLLLNMDDQNALQTTSSPDQQRCLDQTNSAPQALTLAALAAQLRDLDTPPWLVAISEHDDLPTRLSAYRHGAQHFLHNPIDSLVFIQLLNEASQPVQESAFNVLLVDDDRILAELEASMLEAEGIVVTIETDPLQVMTQLEKCQPDALVLDVYMPNCQGTELAAVLRDIDAWQHLPIIFLSGETDIAQQLIALDFGGDDFLAKPVQAEHLVSAVKTRARRWRQHQKLMRKLQTTLYEQEREHLALDQHAIVCVTDALGCIIDVNSKFCAISGYSRSEVMGKNPSLLKSGVTPHTIYQNLWQTISHGQIWAGQLCNKRKNGSYYWSEFSIVPLLDQHSKPYQYVAVGTDITAVKESELDALYQRDLQSIISEVVASMANTNADNLDTTLAAILQTCGRFIKADRAYLFRFSITEPTVSNTHEWCNAGIISEIDNCQDIPLTELSWWFSELSHNNYVLIPDISALPDAASHERDIFTAQGIRSMLCIPIKRKGRPLGFFGFDAVVSARPWHSVEISAFRMLGDALASVFARLRAEMALRTLNRIGALNATTAIESLRTALQLASEFLSLPIATVTKLAEQQASLLVHASPSQLAMADGMFYPLGLYFNALTQQRDEPIALINPEALAAQSALPADSPYWHEINCYLGVNLPYFPRKTICTFLEFPDANVLKI